MDNLSIVVDKQYLPEGNLVELYIYANICVFLERGVDLNYGHIR